MTLVACRGEFVTDVGHCCRNGTGILDRERRKLLVQLVVTLSLRQATRGTQCCSGGVFTCFLDGTRPLNDVGIVLGFPLAR